MSNEADFFVAGGTLRTSAPSYVTRPADAELLQHLQAGEFCYVLTPRQMGKSSLMVRTAQRLRTEGVRVVIIDLTSIGASSSAISADQWYLGLLSRMRSDLRLTTDVQEWWQAHSAFSVSQRFTDFLQQVVLTECADNVVILIDEIDSTLNLPFRDDFFAAIRALYNERANNPVYSRLTFALFGVATPTDLIQDRERTPFNVGHRIDLQEFTLADAEPLRQGLAHQLLEPANAIFQRIFYWTNGHPYLTQKLCQAVVLHTAQWQEESVDQAIDQLVNTAFLSEEGGKDPNLTFVQDRILTSPEGEQRQMLRLYRRVRSGERVANDDRSLIQNRLELYGLVGVAQNMLRVRNQVYKQVFTPAWVDSMMPVNRQQRIAAIAATFALILLVGVVTILALNPNPTCDELRTRFTQNANDSSTRLGALDALLQQGDGCRTDVFDLFYSIDTQEQIALFEGIGDPLNERNRLKNLIGNIYLTLDTELAHDQELTKRWLAVLKNAGLTEDDALVSSITYWQMGREAFQQRNFQDAIDAYERAINVLENKNHLVLHYDLALAYLELAEYDNALAQLDAILHIADAMPVTPTPTISPTPSMSPTSPKVPTATSTRNITSAANEASMPTKIIADSTELPTAIITIELPATHERIVDVAVSEPMTALRNLVRYQQRFRNADTIRDTVRRLIEGNPELLLHYQENTVEYQYLASLDIGPAPVAVASTFTPTSTLIASTPTVAIVTTTKTQLTPLPIVTLTETPTRLPNSIMPYIYRLKIDGCVFAPVARRQTGFRVQGMVGIVTALHGVADCQTITAVTDDGQEIFNDLVIQQADIERDVALLTSVELQQRPSAGLLLSVLTNAAILTTPLSIVSYPLGLDKQDVDSNLLIRDVETLDDAIPDQEKTEAFRLRHSPALTITVLNVQAQLLPGHPGAPLLDPENRLVGVVNGGLRGGTVARSWAIPWSTVQLQPLTLPQVKQQLAELLAKDPVLALAFSSTYPKQSTLVATQVKFSGRIVDQQTKRGIGNTEVLLLFDQAGEYSVSYSDPRGFFVFEFAPSKERAVGTIWIEAAGYEHLSQSVELGAARNFGQILLRPLSPTPPPTAPATLAPTSTYPCKATAFSASGGDIINRIRAIPSSSGGLKKGIQKGMEVEVREKTAVGSEIWYHIFDPEGQELGWILSTDLQLSSSCPIQ